MLSDDQMLNDERMKAKSIKEKMASVIGSGAYYGSYSSNSTSSGDAYQAFNNTNTTSFTNTTKYMHSASGNTFGQMVMKELQEKKKLQVKNQPKPQIIGPSKLNLQKMNEKKPQKKQDKQSVFNNISKKLVKPPQKTTPVLVKTESSPPVSKQQPKKSSNNIFDIMDIDFTTSPSPTVNNTTTPATQPLDFLGISSTPTPTFSVQNNNPVKQTLFTNPYQNAKIVQNGYNVSIKLDLNKQKPKQSNLNSLIDFSDFREEFKSAPSNNVQNNIASTWDW